MNGYLDAINPVQGCYAVLSRGKRWIDRARLGLHLRLSRLLEEFETATDAPDLARLVRSYLAACGIKDDGPGLPQIAAFCQLVELNNWQWRLAFMARSEAADTKPAYDYPHRVWAWWVHKIATRYGWGREQIFELWPEEAAAYLQEIFVAEFEEEEARRALSDVSYEYNKVTKKSRFVPLPRPAWMVSEEKEEVKTQKILKSMLPQGNVIDLGGFGLLKATDEDTLEQ